MKVECSCGVKSEFEIRPEMHDHPVQFVCPACGLDSSAFVDALVRRELGQASTPAGDPVPAIRSSSVPTGVVLGAAPAAPPVPSVRLQNARGASGAADQGELRCARHPSEVASTKCYICSKPICSKCMELFGYVCSPLCKAKADSHGIQLPVYEGQRSRIEARRWRKMVWAATGTAAVVAVLLGLWFWYAWFGCAPKVIFSVRFPDPAYSGQSAFGGNQKDQIVFLHGPILARYDLKSGKQIWSRRIVDQKLIDEAVAREQRATQSLINKANSEAWEHVPKMPSADQLAREMERDATAALNLYVKGASIWVTAPDKVTHYDWQTGKTEKELTVNAGSGEVLSRGNELLIVNTDAGRPIITHVDLSTGTTRSEDLNAPDSKAIAQNTESGISTGKKVGTAGAKATEQPMSGLPAAPNSGASRPLDPAKVAADAQKLSYPEKLALPAVLAGNMNQQRAMKEMDDSAASKAATIAGMGTSEGFSLIPSKDGFVEFSVKLLETRIVTRSAMKPASGKSALDGDVTAGKSMELAGEMLNDMQRENGGDLVQEDHSRYRVTVRRPGVDSVWTGEVVGPPKLYPLESVNVIAAEKLIIVLDNTNRKLWQSTLSYNVVPGLAALDEESATYGQGPCVERKGTLYVFDQGVLAAFNLKTGDARWRLPSVGIAGLFFDDKDMIYVNTTTATHESLKYSRQIDLSQKVGAVIMKLDSNDGKILWSIPSRGLVNYVHGKFILTAQATIPDDGDDPDNEKVPWMRIRRLSPSTGKELWDHFQQRAPLDIAFDQNTIRLVFKKEVQVLRFPKF